MVLDISYHVSTGLDSGVNITIGPTSPGRPASMSIAIFFTF